MENSAKTPMAFWIVIGLALLWNLAGVMAFVSQVSITPEMLAEMPVAEQELYAATPGWVTIAFAFAVFGGALGCLVLLLKKSWSFYLLVLSLIGVCAQMSYVFFVSRSIEVYGPGGMIMPVMVIIIAIALVYFSKIVGSKDWFR